MRQIICRLDSTNSPVVFLLDTLNSDAGTIKAWRNFDTAKEEEVTMDYYKTTRALSDTDEAALARKYASKFNVKDGIILRRRLYWKKPMSDSAAKDNHSGDDFDKGKFVSQLIDAFTLALEKMEISQKSHT